MNKYLVSAIERFDEIKEKNYLISPISKNDVSLIEILLSFLKISGRDDVITIMQSYKLDSDTDIIEQLTELMLKSTNKSIKDVIDMSSSDAKDLLLEPIKYVIIKGERIPEWGIKGYTHGKFWNHKKQEMLWTLTINPQSVGDLKSVPLYVNKQFTFDSQSNLLDVVKKLDMLLSIKDNDDENIENEIY